MQEYFDKVMLKKNIDWSKFSRLKDIDIQRKDKMNLLHAAIAYSNNIAAVNLINMGININAQDSNGLTPLYYAVAHKNFEIVDALLDKNPDISICDKHGNSVLWRAVFEARGDYKIVKSLINHGAIKLATLQNKYGKSPVDFARQIGDLELIQMLQQA